MGIYEYKGFYINIRKTVTKPGFFYCDYDELEEKEDGELIGPFPTEGTALAAWHAVADKVT